MKTILEKAQEVVSGERREDYGDMKTSFNNIAAGWSVIAKTEITAHQVGLMMIWLKTVREANNHKLDNLIDCAGYARCIEVIMSEDKEPKLDYVDKRKEGYDSRVSEILENFKCSDCHKEIQDNSPNLKFEANKGIIVDEGDIYETVSEMNHPEPDITVLSPVTESPQQVFEKGQWYKEKDCAKFFLFRFSGEYDEDGNPRGYGFNPNRVWQNEESIGWVSDAPLEICPPKLVESILRNHAASLGYYKGAELFVDKRTISEYTKIIVIYYEEEQLIAELDNGMNIIVFNTKGKWLERP